MVGVDTHYVDEGRTSGTRKLCKVLRRDITVLQGPNLGSSTNYRVPPVPGTGR